MTPVDTMSADAERFRQQLPWYVNGTLGEDERRWMDEQRRTRPKAQAEWQAHRVLQAAVALDPDAVPADLGWEAFAVRHGLAARVDADVEASPVRAGRESGLFRHRPSPRFIASAGLAIVLCQAVAIAVLWIDRPVPRPTESDLRSTSPAAAPRLQVRLQPQAREAEWRRLLLSIDGRLVGGPSQLGDYLVSVPPEQLDAAQRTLAASPLVQQVDRR